MTTRIPCGRALRLHTALITLLAGAPAFAQERDESDRAAVSDSHFVGDFASRFLGIDDTDAQSLVGGATFYAPIGDAFGIGLGGDFGFGAVEGDFGEAIGLHGAAFWRNPESGYAGAAVIFDHVSEFQRANISAIGGIYLDAWDLQGAAGYDGGDGADFGLFSFEAGWYASEQLRLGGKLDVGTDETISGGVLIHWQPAENSPVTIRANVGGGQIEDEGFYDVGFGLTISFADSKSLIESLRRDRLLVFE